MERCPYSVIATETKTRNEILFIEAALETFSNRSKLKCDIICYIIGQTSINNMLFSIDITVVDWVETKVSTLELSPLLTCTWHTQAITKEHIPAPMWIYFKRGRTAKFCMKLMFSKTLMVPTVTTCLISPLRSLMVELNWRMPLFDFDLLWVQSDQRLKPTPYLRTMSA